MHMDAGWRQHTIRMYPPHTHTHTHSLFLFIHPHTHTHTLSLSLFVYPPDPVCQNASPPPTHPPRLPIWFTSLDQPTTTATDVLNARTGLAGEQNVGDDSPSCANVAVMSMASSPRLSSTTATPFFTGRPHACATSCPPADTKLASRRPVDERGRTRLYTQQTQRTSAPNTAGAKQPPPDQQAWSRPGAAIVPLHFRS